MQYHLQSGNKHRSAWLHCPSFRTGMVFVVLLTLVYCVYFRTFLGHTVDKHPARKTSGPSAFLFGHARTTNAFMSRHTTSTDSSADAVAVGSFNAGVKKEHNDNHAGLVFENHQGFPDQCKGPVGVPGAKAIARFDLTRAGPLRFLHEFKNPCWRKREMGSQQFTMRCLPYAYLAGFPKCGTTDMYSRMVMHPDIVKTAKEPHWITRGRFSQKDTSTIDNYARGYGMHLSGVNGKRSIAVDASASTAWDNHLWFNYPGNENCSEPNVTNADYIRHLNPDVKIIMTLRNPTNRLYSGFMYFARKAARSHTTPTTFHDFAEHTVKKFNDCLKDWSLRHCAYNATFFSPVRLPMGLYTVFIEDWFLRFPRDQILVVRLEDVSADPVGEMSKIFKFLGLAQNLTTDLRYKLMHLPAQNVGKQSQKKGPMLNKTRLMLDNFYRPYNRRLANVLGDEKYTWTDV